MQLVGVDHQDVACAALVECAVELDASLSIRDDHFMFVVVLVPRRVPTRGHRVMAHRKVGSSILATDHHAHRDSLNIWHVQDGRLDLIDATLQHAVKVSVYVLDMAKLRIKGFPLGAWQTNAWLIWMEGEGSRPGWIIDPGDNPKPLIDAVGEHGISVEAILFTHAHLDHIMGLEAVVRAVESGRAPPLPIYAHPLEHDWFGDPQLNLSAFAEVPPVSVRAPTHSLREGDELSLGASRWRVLHTPGHSPGSVSFVCDDAKVVIAGDTLFQGSIGRSDFPTSDPAALDASLRTKLMALPDDFVVHPGHGPSTTIGRERRSNPFLQ